MITGVSLFTENKGQTDFGDIIKIIILVIVFAWVGWAILGIFGLQPPIILLAAIGIVIVIGFVVFLIASTDIFLSEEERRKRKEREIRLEKEVEEKLKKREEERKKEQEIERSILRKRLIKEKADELEGLTEEEKEYLLKKWIEKEEEKELDREHKKEITKPEMEKVAPPSTTEKERLIQIVGTRCCYPNCKETLALEVHHIIPRAEGGTNKENNLVVLCPNHHRMARDGTIPRERLRLYSVAKVKKIR
jgi:5-methylcytosine-specific restriction endonuclease McrA